MLNKLGQKNFTLLGKLMDMSANRHRVIAQNISNVNTPYYRRKEYSFESSLREAMHSGKAKDYSEVSGYVRHPNTTPVRNNGNNVDIDQEVLDLKENATLYSLYTHLYTEKASMVRSAIRGGA